MFNFLKRFFGGYTAYQPGTGRIVPVQLNASSGVSINENTSLTIPAFFHGIRTYGQILGSLDWDLIHHLPLPQRGKEIARLHPVHKLLHDEPNEYQTAPEWRELMVGDAIRYGNSYSYLERNGNFRVTAMLPLLSDRTRPVLDGGRLSYVTMVNGRAISLEPYEVFHFKGFSASAISGTPLVQLMRDTLGLTKAEEEFAAKFFGNGANMGGFINMPGALSDAARQNIKDSMTREYGGVGNAFKWAFLEEGMKAEKVSVNPQEAQFIEGRQFSLGDMARIVGLAPHLLYDLSRSTNNNIEHQGREAVVYSFGPIANRLCKEANRKVLYASEKDEYETKINLSPLMEGDALSQAQVDKADFDMVALTPNERRAKRGLNPIDGGDELYLNTAYLPLSVAIAKAMAATAASEAAITDPEDLQEIEDAEGAGESPSDSDNTPPADPSAGNADPDGQPGPSVPAKLVEDDLDRSAILRPVIADAVRRLVRREAKALANAAKRLNDDPAAIAKWHAEWQEQERTHIAEVLEPVSAALAAAGFKLNGYIEQHLIDSRSIPTTEWEGERIEKAVMHLLGEHE